MPEYVVRIGAEFQPKPGILYKDLNVDLPSFSTLIDEEKVNATPKAGVQILRDTAEESLQREIIPILVGLGYENGKDITLRIITITSYDPAKQGTVGTNLQSTSDLYSDAAIMRYGDPEPIIRRIRWASIDSTYRDLLDLATEALAAPNPRPSGFKMVERLEVKYGGLKKRGRREIACSALGIAIEDLKPILAHQSQYRGDRHAEYDIGMEPARLDPKTKSEALKIIKRIIEEYEKRELSSL